VRTCVDLSPFHYRKFLTTVQIALSYETSTKADKLAARLAIDFDVRAKAYQVRVEKYNEVEAAVNSRKSQAIVHRCLCRSVRPVERNRYCQLLSNSGP